MPHHFTLSPQIGSFVACHVFGVVKQVGIWVGDAIVELHGSGLIRIVSSERFLKDRTGDTIYVACVDHQPVKNEPLAELALSKVYQFRNYDLLRNNCYRFCYSCLSGHEEYIETFSEFNQLLSDYHKVQFEWKKVG